MLDNWNEILFEHISDFAANPLTKEELYLFNTNLTTSPKIYQVLSIGENKKVVTGYHYKFEGKDYKFYTFFKHEIELDEEAGVTFHRQITNDPLATNSASMSNFLKIMTALYKRNQPVYLFGEKGTGKQFIIEQMHSKLATGSLVIVDGLEFDREKAGQLLKSSIGTIIFTNTKDILLEPSFSSFMEKCVDNNICLFVIAQKKVDFDIGESLNITLLKMPNFHERKEDIHE